MNRSLRRPRNAAYSLLWSWTDGHEIGFAAFAVAVRDDQRADAALACARSGLDTGITGHRVDNDAFAVDDVLALTDHDISGERDGLAVQVVNAEIAARILIAAGGGDKPVVRAKAHLL